MQKHNVWIPARLPAGCKPIGFTWVFKVKENEDGSIERYKARLCAQGFSQVPGLDYFETFSPVARHTTIRTLLAVSNALNYETSHFDVKTAFLHGKLSEEVYMRPPQGVQLPSGMNTVRLQRAIYGIKQASRVWNADLHEKLLAADFKQSTADPCLYISVKPVFCAIALIVDDLLVSCPSKRTISELFSYLRKYYDIIDKGDIHWCLGILVERNRENFTMKLSQQKFITDLLSRCKMADCKSQKTPADVKRLSKSDCTSDPKERNFSSTLYHSVVGSLVYLAHTTRPDIAIAVNAVSRYVNNPGNTHWIAVKRILRYLKGTLSLGLTYNKSSKNLVGYSDSDWGGNLDNRRSTTGYLFKIFGGTISWRVQLQPTVALSTVEAEYMAMSSACQEAVWLKRLSTDFSVSTQSISISVDNQSSISLAKNPVFHRQTKHIDIRHHFVRDCLKSPNFSLSYVPSGRNTADILTKPLSSQKFIPLRNILLSG